MDKKLIKSLTTAINNKSKGEKSSKPIFFRLKKNSDQKKLATLFAADRVAQIINTYSEQKEELSQAHDPREHVGKKQKNNTGETLREGVWVYFSWNRKLVHILEKQDYRTLRLSRNQLLITAKEQQQFLSKNIGIAGLNVGNPGAICMTLEGGGENVKLADFDTLSLSNLNRFRAGLGDLEKNKATLTAEQILEIDPYYNVTLFENGITAENIKDFLGSPKLDLLIEEMDNLPLKLQIRELAQSMGIPTIMVTGNGPNIILDIERFDIEKGGVMNGYMNPDVYAKIMDPNTAKAPLLEKINLAKNFMGEKFLTKRLLESFGKVGTSLAGIPQLAEASFLRGAVLSFTARQILTGRNIPSGRYTVRLDTLFKDSV